MPKYYLHSYGCQMNKLDSELVESKLLEAGFSVAAGEDAADVVLLNTCSVRQHAEDRVWSKLGRLRVRKKREPELVVGVLGCMAQEHRRYLQARMPHVDLVVGPSAFGDIHHKIAGILESRPTRVAHPEPWRGAGVVSVDQGVSGDTIQRNVAVRPQRSQAFVSIMRGCNMPCTYCIVPTTRGKEISRPIDVILAETERLVDDGVTEVTLLGQTVNAYGRDLGRGVTLSVLLRRLHEIPALRRLAFITSHPNFLSKELTATLAELPKISPYLHLPAQSGSNRVLKAMRRGYTRERYLARWESLLEVAPHMELHSDWIVGYPGETDEDIAETIDLMERVRFSQSYVFKYSPRPGTVASEELVDDVSEQDKADRHQRLLAVQERLTREHNEALVGSVQEVLIEGVSKSDPTRLTGRTPHHRLVHFAPAGLAAGEEITPERAEDLAGCYMPVRVREANAHSLIGEPMPHDHWEERPLSVPGGRVS